MKGRITLTIAIIALLSVTIYILLYYRIKNRRLHRNELIEAAKEDFLSRQPAKFGFYVDSTYVSGDTVLYYRNDSFLGTSIITTE